ncbi:anthranilate synthase family protein [Actinopolyspora saharensis]|uniref:anthranilate synthase n=1 Tax=Actinopolyspora saharensis TaxID=995062 RepID=A0A1H0Z3T2_9ACTN|nr:anthranilate synthase family protein [Actinopolyspora saharensis]SDQ22024.1 phenazine biosynthesis protein phzE [Actinopolyspora saharensis]
MSTEDTETTGSAAELINRLRSADGPPFALLRRWDPEHDEPGPVEVLIGPITTVEHLSEIPLPQGAPDHGAGHDALALVPFRQIRERGFDCHDDGTPLRVLRVEESHRLDTRDVLDALPDHELALHEDGFDVDDETYAATVKRIVHDEIATGEGANFVIRRDFTARIRDHSTDSALTLFRRLLRAEHGSYWTFLVHAGPEADEHGGRTLVGASPEVHVRLDDGEAVMNPISGTYRYPDTGPDRAGLLRFLADPKENAELSMVLDEELKMMSAVGDRGGRVHGPYLREMAHLAHTEFEIRGRTGMDARDVLRETSFAATVTGSPLENACRVIRRYEPSGRGYYAGALALFSRDSRGGQRLDSPILIRAADIAPDGRVRMPVGATLVRDSDPSSEVAETWTKAAGVLTALGVRQRTATTNPARPDGGFARDPLVAARLGARRDSLAPFWLRPREELPAPTGRALIIDTGDSFTAMLAQVFRSLGLNPIVRGYATPPDELLGTRAELTVLGPGPGNPDDQDDARMARLRELAQQLVHEARADEHPLLGVCLGHQLIGRELGLPLLRKTRPHQGLQRDIDLFGQRSTVGFYNSFTAHADEDTAARLHTSGIELSRDADSGEVHAFRAPNIAGVQFHPESVLTLDGRATVHELVQRLAPGIAPGPLDS